MSHGRFSTIQDHAKKWRDFIFDLIFPKECFSCGEEGGWFCEKCFKNIKISDSQKCFHCRRENCFGDFCPSCRDDYFLDGVWVAGNYEDKIISSLIKNFKYHFIKDLSLILGKYLALFLRDLINKHRFNSFDLQNNEVWRQFTKIKESPNIFLDFKNNLVIPVPLHSKRLKWRGFNQSEIIARELAGYYKVEIDTEKLQRIKYKKAQAKLKAEERHFNIKDCFGWMGDDLNGRNIILVDDVATTGSTLNECAWVLKENGAGEIWGLVIARG